MKLNASSIHLFPLDHTRRNKWIDGVLFFIKENYNYYRLKYNAMFLFVLQNKYRFKMKSAKEIHSIRNKAYKKKLV
jgi:hypothetical protein